MIDQSPAGLLPEAVDGATEPLRHEPLLVGVLGVRGGSTSTHWATCLAWTIAEQARVMLVDYDMEGGTIADLLGIAAESKSIGNIMGAAVGTAALEAQAVRLEKRPSLRVVPGLWSAYGAEVAYDLPLLRQPLLGLPEDVVVVDLGHPVSHAGIREPKRIAETICQVFSRVFVVMRDTPELASRAINVLELAEFPFAEIVVCTERHRSLTKEIHQRICGRLGQFRSIASGWDWDEKRASRMGDNTIPFSLKGVPEQLGLIGVRR